MTTSIARLKTSQPEAAVSISQFKLLDHLREQLASKSCDPDHPGASELRDRIDQLRSEIAHSHFGLVSFVVGRFRRSRVERSEMLGEARLILAKAIDRFDWKRGFQFSTYYVRCAIRHLRHFVARQARIPGTSPISSIEPPTAQEQEPSLTDLVPLSVLHSRLEQLAPRDRALLELRFGVGAIERPHTFEELGRLYGYSGVRIRQRVIALCRRLQKDLTVRNQQSRKELRGSLPRTATTPSTWPTDL